MAAFDLPIGVLLRSLMTQWPAPMLPGKWHAESMVKNLSQKLLSPLGSRAVEEFLRR